MMDVSFFGRFGSWFGEHGMLVCGMVVLVVVIGGMMVFKIGRKGK